MAIQTDEGILTDDIETLELAKEHLLRATINSNYAYEKYHYVFFYDGHPDNGGKLIGSKLTFGLEEGDNYVWTEWKPKEAGKHTIYVHVIGDSDDGRSGECLGQLATGCRRRRYRRR